MNTENEHTQLLTVEQMAKAWQVSRAHMYGLIRDGLPTVTIGRCRRIDPVPARAWLADQQATV